MANKELAKKPNKPKNSKESGERYSITFKGLLLVTLDMDEETTRKIMDALELYLRRNVMKGEEPGAIIFTGKEWVFAPLKLTK